ncbi:MAG: tetratricopeptide repeat protein [Oceanospirillaceae bacterium]|nr:tetratricopeptide repeat protein [Oceanospirillaceae bacterium]
MDRYSLHIGLQGLLLTAALLCLKAVGAYGDYVGSDSCADCHRAEYSDWLGSHHQLAMAEASDDTVLADFNDTSFTYNGITSRFYKRDGRFYVTTDNADGELEEFEIRYTFGVYPLQQYLVDFPDGRKQVLSIIWDTRPAEQGGQRWYHLYPEHPSLAHGAAPQDPVDSDDPVHWTGTYFNWNGRCASCHSTDLHRGYQRADNRFSTTWAEISVGCEACHGRAERHLRWARDGAENGAHKGFAFSLADPGIWTAVEAVSGEGVHPTLKRSGALADRQKQVCASCHSRRAELGVADPRKDFDDSHMLRLLEAPLYYADGQIRDEVYVWGSFLQSRMHGEGVTCSNCHNPHSLKLKAEGNGVCTQCHSAEVFDDQSHHHHPVGSKGAQCANCHMPATTYMGVDARRDHSLRIPRPAQSARVGAPDVCTRCHDDQSSAWAQRAIEGWLEESGKTPGRHPFADAFHAADQGQADAALQLLSIAQNGELPAIVRGSAILRHGPWHDQQSLAVVQRLLQDPEPLVRRGAVASLESLPLDVRYRLLAPQLDDKSASVRVEMARMLAGVPLDRIPAEVADTLRGLYREYIAVGDFNADMPEQQSQVARFYTELGQFGAAESAYRQALKLAPRHPAVLLNFADFYRQTGRDDQALPLLERAVAVAPEAPNGHYALGLYHIRQQQTDAAVAALQKAAELAPTDPRYAYTYALALEQQGEIEAALRFLERWQAANGPQPQVDQVIQKLRNQTQ